MASSVIAALLVELATRTINQPGSTGGDGLPDRLESKADRVADRVPRGACGDVAGRMGSPLHDPADPYASARALDDTRFAIDHFRTKLLRLSTGFQTITGTRMAIVRHDRLQRFLDAFSDEI
ncbi:hypothetical protein NTJ56_33335 [Burkholderia contaminans]|uniref:hypothetical protein n=1 Tax=Burkholderia contaminans TaxID=488447 RepID=UPI001CF5F401|nr:hypothetical protein [Burkholderia contaminans]MCA7917362.1 hypothetical protein [Burkholderia contaminans]UUX42523.1 hypothetical protein NTJ56_33335 [Burkholderia contaminans]